MSGFDVAVVGSVVYDLIAYVDAPLKPGETRIGNAFAAGAGGKGANQCTMAAFLGAKAAIVGKIGDDTFGSQYLQLFSQNGVNTENLLTEQNCSTGVANITVTDSGENTIIVVPGANYRLTVDDVDAVADSLAHAKVVVCQLEVPLEVTHRALHAAKAGGAVTILNPAPAPASVPLSPELLQLCDLLCPNETEAQEITGLPCATDAQADAALRQLKVMGARLPLITLGHRGVRYLDAGVVHAVPAPAVQPVDTTGAGDAFVGSLAFFLACRPDLELREQVRRAVHIASITVTARGTQSSFPKAADLLRDLL